MTKNFESKELAEQLFPAVIKERPMQTNKYSGPIDDKTRALPMTIINKISGCARGAEIYAHKLNQVLDDTDPTMSLSREDIDHLEEIDGCMAVLNHTLNNIYQGEHDRRAEAHKAKIAEYKTKIEELQMDLQVELQDFEEKI